MKGTGTVHGQRQAPAKSPGRRRETVELITIAEPVATKAVKPPVQVASFEC